MNAVLLWHHLKEKSVNLRHFATHAEAIEKAATLSWVDGYRRRVKKCHCAMRWHIYRTEKRFRP